MILDGFFEGYFGGIAYFIAMTTLLSGHNECKWQVGTGRERFAVIGKGKACRGTPEGQTV